MYPLLTDLSPFFVGFLAIFVIFAIGCCYYVMKLGAYCRDAVEYVVNSNKKALTLRRMAEVEATLTELTDSYQALLDSHKKLRSRIGMRAVRENRENGVDSSTTIDKTQLRHTAKQKGLI